MSSIIVSELNIYPLKSAAGISLSSMQLDRLGPAMDRRWMLVDENGRFITQREQPAMALIKTHLQDDALTLSVPGQQSVTVSIEQGAEGVKRSAKVWGDTVRANDCGDEVADYLSRFLTRPCRLLFMDDDTERQIDPGYAKNGELVSFADGFPLLLISQASLDDLNQRLESSIVMKRFRPNLVVAGCEPYAEDSWKTLTIGSLVLDVVKPCSRCVMPSINPETAEKDSAVLNVLASYRRRDDRKIYLGQNLIHRGEGRIAVGDQVLVA